MPLVIVLVASCDMGAARCKVDTDEGVSAAMQRLTGEGFVLDNGGGTGKIVRHPPHFPELAVIGETALDAGAAWRKELWAPRCALVDFGDPGVQQEALRAAGWATADSVARGKLALAWLSEVEQIVILTQLSPELTAVPAAKQRFAPPVTKALPDGSIELLFWAERIQYVYGSPRSSYPFGDITFAPDGSQRGGLTGDTLIPLGTM